MRKLGFTLAEVLITLVIIGVIAAMTIPTLMQNTQGQEYRSAFKKAVASLNQALTLTYALEGVQAGDFEDNMGIRNMFARRLSATSDIFWPAGNEKNTATGISVPCSANNSLNSGVPATILTLTDGAKICFQNFYSARSDEVYSRCNSQNTQPCLKGTPSYSDEKNAYAYASILVDVNGNKKPNQFTSSSSNPKDIYALTLYSQRVVPYGRAAQEVLYEKNAYAS